jgi:ABC-type Mn2+/Zn2+ transport system permease subunit
VLALAPDVPAGVQDLMFGDVLGTAGWDLALAGALAASVLVVLGVVHSRLPVVGFDRSAARAFGGNPVAADVVMLLLLGGFTIVAVQALGNLLVLAVLVGPAAAAGLVTERIGPMMALAALLAVAAGAGGLYLSYYADTAGGASIAAVVVALYMCVAAAARLAGGTRRRVGGVARLSAISSSFFI